MAMTMDTIAIATGLLALLEQVWWSQAIAGLGLYGRGKLKPRKVHKYNTEQRLSALLKS